jgi:hypothetical protein
LPLKLFARSADPVLVPFKKNVPDDPPALKAVTRVSAALHALDPFSFWVVPTNDPSPGDLVVVGTTGVFLVSTVASSGVVNFGVTGADVSGAAVAVRGLKRTTKSLQAKMVANAVAISVEPVVCFPNAMMGVPATVRGVRFLTLKDLVGDIAGRGTRLERARAQRAARALGMHIAGDEKRHFAVG